MRTYTQEEKQTVFFRRQVCSLLVRIPLFVLPKQKAGLTTCFSFWRRARDSNPRTGFDLLHDFQSCSFGQLGQLSKFISQYSVAAVGNSEQLQYYN